MARLGSPAPGAPSLSAVARATTALGRLDAYSFWVVPATPKLRGDLIVVGATGAFLIEVCDLPGKLEYGRGAPTVGDVVIPGLLRLKRAAKRTTSILGAASVFVEAEPIVCLTDAVAGAATTSKGVLVLHVRDLVPHISGRPRVLEHGRAQRGARALGVKLAGDHKRHFTPG